MKNGTLKVAAAQFAVSEDWQQNLQTVNGMIQQAADDAVGLLVLPEGSLIRFMDHRERIRDAAQPIDGPFVTGVRKATREHSLTVVVGIHETNSGGNPYNTLVAIRAGQIVQIYRKLHLYDAFTAVESDNVTADDRVAEPFDVHGFKIGLMTCYDVRFPELARLLALKGAEVITLPAAWAKGSTKEFQWSTLVAARALDNTAYIVASGESGPSCIGASVIVDPLGSAMAQAVGQNELITATLTKERLVSVRANLPVLEHRRFDIAQPPRKPGPYPITTNDSATLANSN